MNNIASQDENSVQCAVCLKSGSTTDTICDTCGYPKGGTTAEQQTFIALRSNKVLDLGDHDKKIKTAATYLKIIGGFTALSGIVVYFTSTDQADGMFVLITNFILGIIYFSLGFWTRSKPMVAIVTGFSIYVLVIILNLLLAPAAAASGFVFKIIVILAFIQSIKAINEANKIKKELSYK